MGEVPPRSAGEADEDPTSTGPPKTSEESSGDARSPKQERQSKPHASFSGQS